MNLKTGQRAAPPLMRSAAKEGGAIIAKERRHGLDLCDAAKGVAILSQPHTGAGTSLTNVWSPEFIDRLMELDPIQAAAGDATLPLGTFRLYEHYYETPAIDQVTLDKDGQVGWKHGPRGNRQSVMAEFERIMGEPMPDFAADPWGKQMTRRQLQQVQVQNNS